jgi:hypothetical protein
MVIPFRQFPLDRGGSEMPWNSPIIITLFTVGGVLGLSFIFVEGKIAKFPVIPGHVFKIRTVVSVYISIFFTGLLYFGEIYYLPIYLQVIRIAKLCMTCMNNSRDRKKLMFFM